MENSTATPVTPCGKLLNHHHHHRPEQKPNNHATPIVTNLNNMKLKNRTKSERIRTSPTKNRTRTERLPYKTIQKPIFSTSYNIIHTKMQNAHFYHLYLC